MDFKSLSYVLAFVYLLNFGVMLYLYRLNKDIKGLRYWFISSVTGIFAFSSVLLKPLIGNYTAFLNNSFILIGFLFMIEGLMRFRHFPVSRKRNILWITLGIFAVMMSFANTHNPTMRYLMYDIYLTVLL